MGHLTAQGLAVSAGGRTLISGIDLDVPSGELVAVVGANGVGKTTLLRTLAGVLAPSAGTVRLDAADTSGLRPISRARVLTLLGGEPSALDGLTVRETIAVGRYAHHAWWDWRRDDADAAAVDAALQRVDLGSLADRPMDTLSSGERARVWLALALAQGAGTLLLDEPTSHLDVRFAHEMLALLRDVTRDGATVIAVLHDLNEAAAYADRVVLLAPGRVLKFDEPRAALTPNALEAAFGIRFDASETSSGYRVYAIPRSASR